MKLNRKVGQKRFENPSLIRSNDVGRLWFDFAAAMGRLILGAWC